MCKLVIRRNTVNSVFIVWTVISTVNNNIAIDRLIAEIWEHAGIAETETSQRANKWNIQKIKLVLNQPQARQTSLVKKTKMNNKL